MDVTSDKGAAGGGVVSESIGGLNSPPFVRCKSPAAKHAVVKLHSKINLNDGSVVVIGIVVDEIDVGFV